MGGVERELLIDLAVCRRLGLRVSGPPAKKLIGEVPDAWLEEAMRASVEWARRHLHHPFHDPLGHFAVLNACRAERYLKEDVLCSKLEGGEWARQRLPSWPVIEEALAVRRGERSDKLDRQRVLEVIDELGNL